MRSILAALVLAPAMMSAQAMHTGISHLVASVDAPEFAFQASALNAAAPHIHTGLIAPIRLNSLKLANTAATASMAPMPGEVTVQYTVDTHGVPQNVQLVEKVNAVTDASVVAAVKEIRYTPGSLNGTPVDFPVVLHVAVK